MSRMIPSIYPPETVSVGERRLFTTLQEQLDDSFTVIHSVPWLQVASRQLQQGECDFLVLHPQFGMLAIEVKPGDVHFDGRTGHWNRQDGSALGKDPYLQAQRSAHTLNSLLAQRVNGWSEANLAHGFAVVFSDADQVVGRLPVHALPLITLLHGDLRHLQDRIKNILGHYGPPEGKPRRELIDHAVDCLRHEFQLIETFSGRLDRQQAELRRLTARQIDVLNLMRDTKRLLIRGCAGSGKTLLALEKAARLSQEGNRVLLLCFNIPLAEWLRHRVRQDSLNVDVFHFHGLCQHLAEAAGLKFQVPAESGLLSDFYDEEAPELFTKAVTCGAGPRYDAIIVDEGQDFTADWWLPIEELLTDREQGVMYIFYDPEQNIFNRDFGFLVDEARLTLDRNCRNTSQIAAYVGRLTGTPFSAAEFAVEGFEPSEYVLTSAVEEVDMAEKIISDLVHKKHISPDQIVIVGKRRLCNSPFADCGHLAGIPLIDESLGETDPNAIRYATIFRFKGLEADCVLLSGFDQPGAANQNRELYCAASRARLMLYVLFRRQSRGAAVPQMPLPS